MSRKIWSIAAVGVLVAAGLSVAASPASAAPPCPDGWCGPYGEVIADPSLNVRTGPGTSYHSNGLAMKGDSVKLRCWTTGEYVSGGLWPSNIWDHITDDTTGNSVDGYTADSYIKTTADIRTLVRHC